jgi:cyclic dehypoxanthinyl futalosine synthase
MSLTRRQALDFLQTDDLIGLGMEADAVRRRLHPEGVVTYTLDRSILCTNGHSLNSKAGGASRFPDPDGIYREIAAVVERGGTGVLLQGGIDSGLKMEWFVQLLQGAKQRFPQVWLQGFPAPEILAMTRYDGLSVQNVIARLRDAGLDSIPGDGAGTGCSVDEWLEVHRTAHRLGMRTAAAMSFGINDSFEQRLDFLEKIRQLQNDTGGFTAFIPKSLSPANGAATVHGRDEATAVESLKMLAIGRLCLENVENMQSDLATQGLKVLQLGLRFGGNDAGAVMPENSVAATSVRTTEEELRRVIRDAGFKPVQRDTLYRTMFLN